MPPNISDLQTAIGELRSTISESGPRRFTNRHLAGRLIHYLEANIDDIQDAITVDPPLECESTMPTPGSLLQTRPPKPHVVLLYLTADDWEILEDTIRMDCESKNLEPQERRRIQAAFDSIGVVRGMEIRFEPNPPDGGDPLPLGNKADQGTKVDDGLKSVRFLPVRIGTDEIVVAVVEARVIPDLVDQTRFLEALQRAVTDWARNTEGGRHLRQFSSADLNIGDLASHGIDEQLSERLSSEGIHDLDIDELLAQYSGQRWLYDMGLLSEEINPDDNSDSVSAADRDCP